MIQFAAGGRTASTIARARPRRTAAGQQLARNPFGLTLAEVRAEVRRCLARGWQLWEIRARFLPGGQREES